MHAVADRRLLERRDRGVVRARRAHDSARAPRRRAREGARGLTLVEVLVVVVIAVLLVTGMVFASGQIQRSRLKASASRIVAAMRVAYQRASSTGRRIRLVLDFDSQNLWLEESTDKMLLKTDDILGTGGADPATEAERSALAEANRINAGIQPARASFQAVAGPAGEAQPLRSGIVFRAVDASHDTQPRTSGRGYVYFFASEAERASVQVKIAGSDDDKDTFSIVLAPLSAKATIMEGPVAVAHPRDDEEASEAEDDGH